MLKVGVLGAGHLGKIHLKLLQQSDKYELIGFFDPNPDQAKQVSQEFGYPSFKDIESLVSQVDVVDIVTPTLSHYECAQQAIKQKRHVFLEKPIANTVAEAQDIIQLARQYGVMGQVGHVERFNPAFTGVKDSIKEPMFVEIHRLSEFNPRGTDVPVVLDLMIHDIDVLLSVVPSEIVEISSNGVSVISHSPDIANARITFANGCVANLTASRISMKSMRKARFFQKDAYISVDFLEKKSEIVQMKDVQDINNLDEFAMTLQNAEGEHKQIYFDYPTITPNNAILDELKSFADAINNHQQPVVTLEQGTKALEVATQIVNGF